MLQSLSGTPCPVPPSRVDDSIISSTEDDTTQNIEFTSAFGTGTLKNTKPRRLRNAARKSAHSIDFAIYEDAGITGEKRNALLGKPARRSVISQPAQRHNVNARVSFAPAVAEQSYVGGRSQHESTSTQHKPSSRLIQAPRRPIIKHEDTREKLPLPSLPEDVTTNLNMTSTTVLKPARRGTIYIPNEDTTMPSMYMGIFSPIKNLNASVSPDATQAEMEITGIAAQMAKKRTARRSMITLSPKRGGPLQLSSRNLQETAVVEDRLGQGGGKENVPPGHTDHASVTGSKADRYPVKAKRQTISCPPASDSMKHELESSISRLYGQTASSMGRVVDKKATRVGAKPGWNSGVRVRTSQPVPVKTVPPPPRVQDKHVAKKVSVPNRFIIPSLRSEPVVEAYPVFSEDLASTSVYEDSWLNHQEIAITQLVNNLFSSSSPTSCPADDGMLRIRLLEIYSSTDCAMLHKRLQGALLYGALSIPQDVLKGAKQLSNDLGRRKVFTDLWLETYDLRTLRTAVEVVFARQCTIPTRVSSPTRRSLDKEDVAFRRSLQRFIEALLIRNEDGRPDDPSTDRDSWSYQRTILRSLMVISLLDATKTSSPQLVSSCLFQASSAYKSSVDVVRALFQLLNPSAGDPVRALSHIGYNVSHAQYPLEEYAYNMDNLAIDLRDGVRLTRLVELLLYPSASQLLDHANDPDATTTVLLPTGELLSLTEGQNNWPLSQHLKFPCLGRATKLYNVQIALTALQGVKGMGALVQDVRPEDIVDGFREKTVKLLWGLTSKWGLSGLLDWADVEREIKRLCRLSENHDNDFFGIIEYEYEDEDDPARYKLMLKSWAQAVASRKGLVVKNLTTSFADGKVFEAIVDEYEGYISNQGEGQGQGQDEKAQHQLQPLCDRLRRLGCSEQFSTLFSTSSQTDSNRMQLFDRDFVLAALAFLCSRLLAPSRGVRAAVTVQKAWRAHWARTLESRKRNLKIVAEGCAEAVILLRKSKAEDEEALPPTRPEEIEIVLHGTDREDAHQYHHELKEEDIWLGL
ncbi:hypothetical protein LTR93_009163 [Exophiala xenobiotica]|nr:hypothetical protein LTR93_009163 [Exophiala xenobiotica]KAK5412411.1 hypothetical protein LTR06_005381 [Exophiala xenobiotica]